VSPRGVQYDTAQICRNGHIVNAATQLNPQDSEDFCSKCGAATITQCTDCGAAIQGARIAVMISGRPAASGGLRLRPAFCTNCGKPFPWTRASLDAARALTAELNGLTESERADLAKTLPDLVADTAQTVVAASRFKRLMTKAGKEASSAFERVLVEVIAETAKRQIWGSGPAKIALTTTSSASDVANHPAGRTRRTCAMC